MMNHHGVFVAYCAGENFHLTTVTDKGREGLLLEVPLLSIFLRHNSPSQVEKRPMWDILTS